MTRERNDAYIEDDLLWLAGRREDLAAQQAKLKADQEAAAAAERPALLNLKLRASIEDLRARTQQSLQQYVGRTDVPAGEIHQQVMRILRETVAPQQRGTLRDALDWALRTMGASEALQADEALKGSPLERLVASHSELEGLKIPPSDEPKPTDMTPAPRVKIRINGQLVGTATDLRHAPSAGPDDLSAYLYSWRWDGTAYVTGHGGTRRTLFTTAMAHAFTKATGQPVVYFCASGQAVSRARVAYAAHCKSQSRKGNVVFSSWMNGQDDRVLRGINPSLVVYDSDARPDLSRITCPILIVTETVHKDQLHHAAAVWKTNDDRVALLKSRARSPQTWTPLSHDMLRASFAPAPTTETVPAPADGPGEITLTRTPYLNCPRHGHTPVAQAKMMGTAVSICGKCLDTFEQETDAMDSDVLKVKTLLEEARINSKG